MHGSWLNKDVLMLNEAISSTLNKSQQSIEADETANKTSIHKSDDGDSIFNIELSNVAQKTYD